MIPPSSLNGITLAKARVFLMMRINMQDEGEVGRANVYVCTDHRERVKRKKIFCAVCSCATFVNIRDKKFFHAGLYHETR